MLSLVILVLLPIVFSLDNGLGKTPAMGWNSWNKFNCNINETLIRDTADVLVSSGLAAAGYIYLNLDDCWQLSRDAKTKEIQADPKTFPSGMKDLGDYIHSKGLLYGLYSDAGTHTCAGRPGGLFHEAIDARTYAAWGVDYLKYDNCNNKYLPPKWRYERMRNALNATGRPIYFSMCEWGLDAPWDWGHDMGNSWRTTDDINDNWESMIHIFELQAPHSDKGAIGGWNDPDMLEVGNGNMTTVEYQTHFALWAIIKAPLLIGCDVTNMTNDTFNILTNMEIIGVNQDPLGVPAVRLMKEGDKQIWGGPLQGGYVVCFLNTGTETVAMNADFSLFGLDGVHFVRDLIEHQNIGFVSKKFQTYVEPHGVVVIKLTPKKAKEMEMISEFVQMSTF